VEHYGGIVADGALDESISQPRPTDQVLSTDTLADRSCLGIAKRLGPEVLTADRA